MRVKVGQRFSSIPQLDGHSGKSWRMNPDAHSRTCMDDARLGGHVYGAEANSV